MHDSFWFPETLEQYKNTLRWRDVFHRGGITAYERGEQEGLSVEACEAMRDSQWAMRDDLQWQLDQYEQKFGKPSEETP